MSIAFATAILESSSLALTAAAIAVLARMGVSNEANLLSRLGERYLSSLDAALHRNRFRGSAKRICAAQLLGIVATVWVAIVAHNAGIWILIVPTAIGPAYYLRKANERRAVAIGKQMDAFMLTLANALKATPSLTAALEQSAQLMPDPLGHELATALVQTRLGSSTEAALRDMAMRNQSRQLDEAVAALLVGHHVGGNLPQVLERAAATLREMARLDGIVRTKTAEGKMQLWVIALFPVGLLAAFRVLSPDYFAPLTHSAVGALCVLVATGCWAGALIAARKILAVDI